MDQQVFQDIAIIEKKAIDWLLETERPTIGRDDRIRVESILRKGEFFYTLLLDIVILRCSGARNLRRFYYEKVFGTAYQTKEGYQT